MYTSILAAYLCYGRATASILDEREVDQILISVATAVPNSASPPINTGFASFAFEERSFYYYFGTPDKPNTFSHNLVNSIAEKMNGVPTIRIGGTSLDVSQYDPNQSSPIQIPKGEGDNGIPSNMTFGPSYFDVFATFSNAKYVVDVPMKKNKLENSKLFAKDAYEKIGAERIVAFEIGNEPDNYGLSLTTYVKRWINWSAQILEVLGIDEKSKIFQAVCLGSQTGETLFPGGAPNDWKVPDIFENGLKSVASRIGSVSMHYYQTKANRNSDLQYDIMNHTAVVRGSKFVKDAVDYLNKLDPPIPLALAEVGSALGNSSDNSPLENVLGSALWQVDFFLYSMSIGVNRINWQSGLIFPFALWNPEYTRKNNTIPKSIHAAFYGQIFAAEFLGRSGKSRIDHLALGLPLLSAYAMYDAGKLARIAVCNLQLWSRPEDGELRPNRTVTLDIGESPKSVQVRKLTSGQGGTASVENITWGGMQWYAESAGQAIQVMSDTETLPVANGKVEFDVKASEAVMVFLEY